MNDKALQTTPPAGPPATPGPVPVRGDVIETYEAMFLQVPEATGDGVSAILEQIANAATAADLDRPWRTEGMDDYLDSPIVIRTIRRLPSDFDSGLGWYLVVDAADVATGELVTFTTGAVSVVAQLVKAWLMGALPLRVIPRRATRPSKSGYYAWHLQIVGTAPAPAG